MDKKKIKRNNIKVDDRETEKTYLVKILLKFLIKRFNIITEIKNHNLISMETEIIFL